MLVNHSVMNGDMLSRLVVANYHLSPPVKCFLFNPGINDVYVVHTATTQYILRLSRVNRYGPFNESAYQFELELLHFLYQHGISVALPVARRNHEPLGILHAPEGKRYYVLFQYAEGKVIVAPTEAQATLIGTTLARFHCATNTFASMYTRFHLGEEYLINEPLRRLKKLPFITSADIDFLESLCITLRQSIRCLSQHNAEYGIVHGDFYWNNLHFAGNNITLFDFDYCGYGWRIWDIAAWRANARMYDCHISNQFMDAFLSGYQSIRALTELERLSLPAFEKMTVIWVLGVWSASIDVLGTRWFYDKFSHILTRLTKWGIEEEQSARWPG
ncbi:MAG: phosphotransferase [Chloroflexaceae bacterium]|nr:phosphotransferase [Chloroflexaceae bacterium]